MINIYFVNFTFHYNIVHSTAFTDSLPDNHHGTPHMQLTNYKYYVISLNLLKGTYLKYLIFLSHTAMKPCKL